MAHPAVLAGPPGAGDSGTGASDTGGAAQGAGQPARLAAGILPAGAARAADHRGAQRAAVRQGGLRVASCMHNIQQTETEVVRQVKFGSRLHRVKQILLGTSNLAEACSSYACFVLYFSLLECTVSGFWLRASVWSGNALSEEIDPWPVGCVGCV